MRLFWSFFLAVVVLSYARGQTESDCRYSVKGVVLDLETKAPLSYVSVLIKGTTMGKVTDEEGKFEFNNLCDKEQDLEFSYLGYQDLTHHHDFHHPFIEIFLAPEQYELQGVVVEAVASENDIRTLGSVKLGQEAIQAANSKSLGDVLDQIAGVNTLKTGQNVVKPIIHGLHSNRVLIMNNGIRHEFQNWGEDHAPEIDPSSAEDIELVKGAATVRFGPSALGGVVLINPPDMDLSTPWQGNINLTGQTNGRAGIADVNLMKGFKWASFMAGGSILKQGDLRAPNYQLTNTGREELSYYGGVRFHILPELDVEGYYSHFDQKLGILRGSTFGNLDDLLRGIQADTPLYTKPFSYDIDRPRQEVQHDLYKASARYTLANQSIEVQYGYQKNRRKEFAVRRGDAPNINLELVTQSVDADWHHPSFGNFSGRLGFQWLKKANDNLPGTNTVPFIPNYDEKRFGVYLIESIDLGDQSFEIGARYDYMDSRITGREPDNTIYRNTIVYRNFTGTLGYERKINEHYTFRTNIGTAWRPPDVAELYRFGQHNFFIEYGLWRYTIDTTFDFVTTREGILTQEDRPVPAEVGYKWINTFTIEKPNFRAEITGYLNYIQNYIYAKPGGFTQTVRGYFVFFIYDQTDALFWGLDLASEWRHSDLFTSDFQASYLWAQQMNPTEYFVGTPPARLGYAFHYHPKIKGFEKFRLTADLSYTFEQFQHPRILTIEEFLFAAQEGIDRFQDDASDFDIIPPPPGFFLVNLMASTQIKKFGIRFQVQNLFNTSYRLYTERMRYFADDLGRNFILSLSYNL
jgi:iron complex outermembrane receptor protein